MKDYYNILGIKSNATTDEIKKAHRKLSLKFHPDKNDGDPFFAEMFKKVQEAYETLRDESKRKTYNLQRNNQTNKNSTNRPNPSKKSILPDIEYFRVDKGAFEYNKAITFSWKCINADNVELKPFGKVNIKGTKTIKIKNSQKETLEVKLIAINNHLKKQITSTIKLKNLTYNNPKTNIATNKSTGINSDQILNYLSAKPLVVFAIIFIIIMLILTASGLVKWG